MPRDSNHDPRGPEPAAARPHPDAVLALAPAERREAVESFLRREIAQRAGVEASAIGRRMAVTALGLDSLAAIELAGRIEEVTGLALSPVDLLRGPTLEELAALVLARLEAPAVAPPGDHGDEPARPLEEAEAGQELQPLSQGQRALWFADRLAPGEAVYNVPVAARVEGALGPGTLERALAALSRRHPALRTTFSAPEGWPLQRVHERLDPDFLVEDASGWSEERLGARLAAEAWRPFDLEEGPPLRVRVFTGAPDGPHLLLVIHHLVADFWSLSVLARELARLYGQEAGGAPAELAPLALRYTDWARRQEQRLAGPPGERLLAWWRERLTGIAPLDLPADRPRPPLQTYRGASRALFLVPAAAGALRGSGAGPAAAGTTLYVVLLAAFQALLHRYSGQEDLPVGSPTAGRAGQGPEVRDVVGYFVNPVVLRGDLSGRPSFAALLARCRATVLAALAHADYPFPLLAEKLQPARDPARPPLYQVILVFQGAVSAGSAGSAGGDGVAGLPGFSLGEDGARVRLGDLTLESLGLSERRVPCDLLLAAAEIGDGGIGLSLQFNGDLFDGATAARMLGHLATLLAAAAADPARPIVELPLLGEAERTQILLDWSGAGTEVPGEGPLALLHQGFERQADRTPAAPALVWGTKSLTYAELERRANALAWRLHEVGVGPEARVGVMMDRRPEMAVALLAVLKAGGAYVPLDPSYPAERLDFLLADARVAAVLAEPERPLDHLLAPAGPAGPVVLRVPAGGDPGRGAPAGRPPCGAVAGNLAYLIYTSGSTGRPKGVAIEHRSAAAFVRWAREAMPAEDLAGVLAATSISFDLSVFELFVPWSAGGTVILADNVLALPDLPAASGVTLVNTVPSGIAGLLRLHGLPPSVRTVNLAGEPLPADLVARIHREPGVRRVFNLYGPSEDTTYSTFDLVEPGARTVLVGRPIAGTRAYLLDGEMQPLPPGVPGELCLGGAGLARGYLDRPELTAERFVPDPFGRRGERLYHTGDLARHRADGRIDFLGRIDHQVKVRGFRIELGELEAALRRHPAVADAAVLVRGEAGEDRDLAAFYVPRPDGTGGVQGLDGPDDPRLERVACHPERSEGSGWETSAAGEREARSRAGDTAPDLRSFLQRSLPAYMVPAVFLPIAALPLTPSGKVDRRALAVRAAAAETGFTPAYTAPRGALEEALAGIWSEALGAARVGVEDDFFALGGHSLKAVRVLHRLREAHGIDLPLSALFEAPTVARLAARIEAGIDAPEALPPILPQPRSGSELRGRSQPSSGPQPSGSSEPLRKPQPRGSRPGSGPEPRIPLSYGQRRLWYFEQLAPGSAVYVMAGALHLEGDLDLPVLAACLAEIVRRHEALRTTFPTASGAAGGPYQRIEPPGPLHLPVIDLAGLVEKLPDEPRRPLREPESQPLHEPESRRLAHAFAQRGFDLARGPLLRAGLVRLGPERALLLVAMHHIVADGWSLGVFARELGALYEAFLASQPSPLPELPVQYADFAVWQRRWLDGGEIERQLGYWRERLAGLLPLDLPADRPRPPVQTFRGARVPVRVPETLAAELSLLARRQGTTLFAVLLAAFQALLARESGRGDVAVAVPVAGRRRPELTGLIGFFVNTLVLRTDLADGPSFGELIQRVRRSLLEADAHQDLPFDKLVEALPPEEAARWAGRPPLAGTLFTLASEPPRLRLGGRDLVLEELDTGTARLDLSLFMSEEAQGLSGTLEYAADLFDAATALRIAEGFAGLLAHLAARPGDRAAGGELPEECRRQVLAAGEPAPAHARPAWTAPRTPVEELVAQIWASVLRVSRVGVHDRFLDLGGHSLLATQVVARVRDAFGVELPLRALFEEPTVAGLAARIERARQDGAEATAPITPAIERLATAADVLAPAPGPAPEPGSPALREIELPLSFAQQRLWFLWRLAPESPAYNLAGAFRLAGPLDEAALATSLREVVRRHEALRTRLPAAGGEPVQAILPEPGPSFILPVVDLSALPLSRRRAAAEALAAREARRPFDLERGPLLRTALLRLDGDPGAGERVLLATLHHVAGDARSIQVLLRELALCYGALAEGRPSPLVPPPIQYGDFAVWQRRRLAESGTRERALAYWARQLADLPALELPADRPRTAMQSFRGAALSRGLPAPLAASLQALGRRLDVTPFMLLLAGFQAVLARTTGQEDFAVGSPVAGRERSEIEGLVGCFVNTLVLRAGLAGDPPFQELVARVRETALAAYAHQDTPFELLAKELAPERDPRRQPFFQTMFQLLEAPAASLAMAGSVRLEPLEIDAGAAPFDLALEVQDSPAGLRAVASYGTDLFDATTVSRLVEHWLTLLAGAAAEPGQRLAELPLLSPAERHQLLREWNDTAALESLPVHHQFAAQAAVRPDAVAVAWEDEQLTYGELDRRAGRLARHLRSLGVRPSLPVGLCMDRSPALAVALLALWKAGGAFLPLDPDLPRPRLAMILEDAFAGAAPAVVVVGEHGASAVAEAHGGLALRIVRLDDLPAPPGEEPWLSLPLRRDGQRRGRAHEGASGGETEPPLGEDSAEAGPRDLSHLYYTSGTTGRPKGVLVDHAALANTLAAGRRAFGLDASDRMACVSAFTFDVFLFELWGPLLAGGSVVLVPVQPVLDVVRLMERLPAMTGLHAVPAVMRLIVDEVRARGEAAHAGGALRTVYTGGDSVPEHLLDDLREVFPRAEAWVLYGPTEGSIFCSAWRVPRSARTARTLIGRPLANLKLTVRDRHGNLAPLGAPGELVIGGAGTARGYLNRDELDRERFAPFDGEHSYRTGDLVRQLPDGTLQFLGRADRQVKIRGVRIELEDVEAALLQHPEVREAAVVAAGDGERRLVAYVACGPGADAPLLRGFLEERLPAAMVPSAIVSLERLPRTVHAKVDLEALPAPDPLQLVPEEAFVAPRDAVEEAVAGIWRRLLEVDRIGVHDNFFAAGGHSLLAARAVAAARDVLGVEIPLRDFFEGPTIARLAAVVRALGVPAGGEADEAPLVRRPRPLPAGGVPLSFAQQRLWFLHQLAPDSPFYNMPAAFRLEGRLDAAALAAALGEIVRRHEALRTRFSADGEQAVQVVEAAAPLALPMVDLSGLPVARRWAAAMALATAEARRPFDLGRAPLLRAGLLRLGTESHLAWVNLHHIVSDGWSVAVLHREYAALYEAFAAGRPSPLPELPVQYVDYALWQRDWLAGEVRERQLAYWRGQLDAVPVLELPTDRPRPPTQRFSGAVATAGLPAELAAAVGPLALRHGATPFMLLLAAFQALLHRHTAQEEIVVGSPIANRTRREVEELIGFFVNALVVRTDVSGDPSFGDLVGRVREVAVGAYAHQALPFDLLVEELEPERDLRRQPLFQVMFQLQPPVPEAAPAGLRMERVDLETGTAHFDLELDLIETPAGLTALARYATALFDAATVRRLLAQFCALLAGAAAEPSRRLSELPLLGAAERHQLLREWNDTAAALESLPVHVQVAAQAAVRPEAVAVAWEDEQLTYGEFDRRAERLAGHLLSLGVRPSLPVGLCMDRSPALVVGLFALWKAGGAFLPLDPDLPRTRLSLILEDAFAGPGPAVVLADEHGASAVAEARGDLAVRIVRLDAHEGASGGPAESQPSGEGAEAGPRDLSYLFYTSGTTGRPKGVLVEHAGLANTLAASRRAFRLDAGDRIPGVAAFTFDAFLFEVCASLSAGGTTILMPVRPVLDVVRLVEQLPAATRLIAVPAVMRVIVEEIRARGHGTRAGDALRSIWTGGDIVPGHLLDDLREVFPRAEAWVLYGPTEGSIFCSSWRVPRGAATSRTLIGRPIANSRLTVRDRQGNLTPLGAPGEIVIGGAGTGRGYLNRADLDAERFVTLDGERSYRTGDLARLLPDGTLQFLGRADRQVKIRGVRIELEDVEAALLGHPAVREAAVVAAGDGAGERRLVAYVACGPGIDVPRLREFLEERLPAAMVPSAIELVERLPRTTHGKVDPKALPASEPAQPGPEGSYVAPRDAVEEALAGIWRRLLEVERVGIHDNFFAIGGHSLLAARAVAAMRDAVGVEVPLRDFFEGPTIAGLAEVVRELAAPAGAGEDTAGSPILPRPRPLPAGGVPLSYAQRRLWFLHQLAPGSPFYNMPAAFHLAGRLDAPALEAAFGEIVRRHEALRTRFVAGPAGPLQEVEPAPRPALPVVDLAGLPEARRRPAAVALATDEARRPFDLARAPLFSAGLLRLGPESHLAWVNMHHIVSDGWSVAVLQRECAALYEAFAAGRPSPLPELPVQYADYALWQRDWLAGEVRARQIAYWKDRLAGLPALALPTDRPRPSAQRFSGAAASVEMPAELAAAVSRLAVRQSATPFMLLLAAFQALLHRYTAQEEIVVGSPIANRDHVEVEGLIGFFVNTLVLRTDVSGDPAFGELVGRVREVAIGAYAHQAFPFDLLVEELEPERDLGKQPLFQVMFQLQPPVPPAAPAGLRMERVDLDPGTAHFDLGLDLIETPAGLTALARYATDLFDAATVRRLLDHLHALLAGAVAEPSRRLSELPLLGAAERHQVELEWSDTAAAVPQTSYLRRFEERAAAAPGAVAVAYEGSLLTYGELDRRAGRLARRLRELGVGQSVPVGLCAGRGLDMVVGMLAIWKAGGAFLPLDPEAPRPRLAAMLEDAFAEAAAAVVLVEEHLAPVLPVGGARLVPLAPVSHRLATAALDTGPRAVATAASLPERRPGDLAYLIYTSGTTGRPKAVLVEDRSLSNLLAVTGAEIGWRADDRMPCLASFSFDIFLFELLSPLAASGTAVLFPVRPALDVDRLVARLGELTRLHAVPSLMRQIVERILTGRDGARAAAAGLRTVFVGGEAVPADLLAEMRAAFPDAAIQVLYGPTEGTVLATRHRVGQDARPLLGRPLGNVAVRLRDRAGRPVPIGVAGEVWLGGAGVSRGYLHREELTRECYVEADGGRWYRTGDLARFLPDGHLEFRGRLDHQVKIRGFRLEPGEVEAVLAAHPAVREAAVVAREDEPGDRRLVAYVTCDLAAADLAPLEHGRWEDEQVERWRTVYDNDLFGREPEELEDPTFDISGWNSSYTGGPIPAEQMREWVDGTVGRILARQPRNVLEIGCGTGLLLFRIAPVCSRYVGTDFSQAALGRVRRVLDELPPGPAANVELRRAEADEVGRLAERFDAVLLNSVVQYFPGIDYLLRVLGQAVARVEPGGFVFVGDVRSLPLLPAFQASVELFRAPAAQLRERLARRVAERIAAEPELALDPALFAALPALLPRIRAVEVQLRRGRHANELTRFRYDVVLHVEREPAAAGPAWLDWSGSLAEVREQLARERPPLLGVRGIPNARVAEAVELERLLRSPEAPRTAGELRETLAAAASGVDPEDLWNLAGELPYEAAVTWSASGGPGCVDLVLRRRSADGEAPSSPWPGLAPPLAAAASAPDWSRWASHPLRPRLAALFAPRLRAFAEERLPDYMVPSAVVVLDRLPLTPQGKVDRQALPAPERDRDDLGRDVVAPRTPEEQALAEIWREVLGLAEVSVFDDFFALGGHSLLATQAVSRIRRACGVELELKALFEQPTIAGLAERVRAAAAGAASPRLPALGPVPRQGEPPVLPLSFGQQRLWILDRLDPGSAAYNMPAALRFEGPLDVAALAAAACEVVRRHEVLRTTYGDEGQALHPPRPVPLPRVDLAALPAAARHEEARRLRRDEERRPFDLARGPVLRAMLLRLGRREHVLLATVHHIATDGWSMALLTRELTALYAAFSQGRPSPLPELAVQYADFAVWQRRWLDGEVLAAQIAHWRERLAGLPPLLELPTDRPRPAVQSARGGRRARTLPAELTGRLRTLAGARGTTLFVVTLAAFQALLSRLTGEVDLAVGTPIAGRRHLETEGLIGFFVNTLVMRGDLDGDPTFAELLARAHRAALAAFAHQDLPFERLVEELQPQRSLAHAPLFQVLFALQNVPAAALELPGLAVSPLPFEEAVVRFDLEINLFEAAGPEGDRLLLTLDYAADLFDAATAERLAGSFEALLERLDDSARTHLSKLEVLSAAERHQLLAEWGEAPGAAEPAGCVLDRFEAQVERSPDDPALGCGAETLSYRDLDARANRIAWRLVEVGVGAGTVVGLHAGRSAGLVAGLLGIWKAGGAYLPLDPSYPAERLAYMLADSGAAAVLSDAPHALPPLPRPALPVLPLRQEAAGRAGAPPRRFTAENLAYLLYTSGTTGRPKAVLAEHRNLLQTLAAVKEAFGFAAGERMPAIAPFSFDIFLFELFSPLLAGGTSVLVPLHPTLDLEALLPELARASRFHAVPAVLRQLVDRLRSLPAGRRLARLREVYVGGDAVPAELLADLREVLPGTAVRVLYGPTETALLATSYPVPDHEHDTRPLLGRPLARARIVLRDRHGRLVPLGAAGEVWIGGPGVTRGYLGRTGLTAERFVPAAAGSRLYRTGDVARWRTDGTLQFLGRTDHQVKVRGFRVELGEIEARLAAHPGVHQAVVAARRGGGDGGEVRLVAYVVPRGTAGSNDPGAETSPGTLPVALRAALRAELPDYMIPAAFVLLTALPLTRHGKVDRPALPTPERDRAAAGRDFVAPRDAVEAALAGIWCRLLEIDSVGVHDSFFDLGGHSLLATRVVAAVRESLGAEVPLRALFEGPTIAELAVVVAQQKAAPADRDTLEDLLDGIDELSDEEVEALLAGQAPVPGVEP